MQHCRCPGAHRHDPVCPLHERPAPGTATEDQRAGTHPGLAHRGGLWQRPLRRHTHALQQEVAVSGSPAKPSRWQLQAALPRQSHLHRHTRRSRPPRLSGKCLQHIIRLRAASKGVVLHPRSRPVRLQACCWCVAVAYLLHTNRSCRSKHGVCSILRAYSESLLPDTRSPPGVHADPP